jgi:hypothetical protein
MKTILVLYDFKIVYENMVIIWKTEYCLETNIFIQECFIQKRKYLKARKMNFH